MSKKYANWGTKSADEFTIEDALQAMREGVCFVCQDGRVKHLSFEQMRGV